MTSKDPYGLPRLEDTGIELLPRQDVRLADYVNSLPASWAVGLQSGGPASEFVMDLWNPLEDRARGFVFRLASLTVDLALAISAAGSDPPALLYVCSKRGQVYGWLAGLPASHPDSPQRKQAPDLPLPSSYRQWISVHNGFYRNGNPVSGLYGLQHLSQIPGQGAAADNSLLAFWGYEGGTRQCFDLNQPTGRQDYRTVAWDPESQSARRPLSFWSFLKELSVKDLL